MTRSKAARSLGRQLAQLEKSARDKGSTPQLGTSSMHDDGTIPGYDMNGTLKQIIGYQPDGTTTVTQVNGPVPPAPSTPTVVGGTLAAVVTWDGTWAGGAVAPLDLARVDVHLVPSPAADPLTYPSSASIVAQGWGEASLTPPPGTWYVRLVAWTTSGQHAASPASDPFDVNIVEVPGPTDPPAAAPVISINPFAIGALLVEWEEVDGAEWYDVYASTTPGFDHDNLANRVLEHVTGAHAIVAAIGGTQIPVDGSLTYVTVKAVNSLGQSAASNEASGAARQADAEFLSALYAYFGTIEAQTAILGSLNVVMNVDVDGVISIGDRITIADPNAADDKGGITIWGDDAHTIILARLHPDGNYLDGVLVAQDITVMKALRLIGTASAIASGAKVKLENGVADPTAPSLTAGALLSNWPAVPGGYSERGICWDAVNGQWWQLLLNSGNNRGYVRTISTAGVAGPSVILGDAGYDPLTTVWGITALGSRLFVGARRNGGGAVFWSVDKYDIAVTSGEHTFLDFTNTGGEASAYGNIRPLLSNDGTYVLCAIPRTATSPQYVLFRLDPSFSGPAQFATFSITGSPISSFPRGGGVGSFDLGAAKFVISDGTHIAHWDNPVWTSATVLNPTADSSSALGFHDLTSTTPTMTRDATYDWTAASTSEWMAYKSSGTLQGFYTSKGDAKLARYSGYYPAAGEKWWAQYADTGAGGIHTGISPESAGLSVPARRFVTVALSPAPTGVTGADVYVGYGSSSPGVTKAKRTETLSGRTLTLTNGKVTGTDAMPGSNTMGGSPAQLFDDYGNSWQGDGTISMPGLVKSGRGSIAVVGAGTPTAPATGTGSVVFTTPFPLGVGEVEVICAYRGSNPAQRFAASSNESRTGFDVTVQSTVGTGVSVSFVWHAIVKTEA